MLWIKKLLVALLPILCFVFSMLYNYQYEMLEDIWDRMRIKGFSFVQSQGDAEEVLNTTLYDQLQLPQCPEQPPNLSPILNSREGHMSLINIALENPEVRDGGKWAPKLCKAQQRIAIIIPYRNRQAHLKTWLKYMHPLLQKQQAEYGVYVAEQIDHTTFNRGKLMNVGFKEAEKDDDYDCFIFSDVDIIPMDERNLFRCSQYPKHMANSLDKFNFRLPYETLFGGIVAFKKEHFLKVNGFSNRFWGWGGEDDELYNRVVAAGLRIERPDPTISRSKMIVHHRDPGNEGTGKSNYLIHQAHLHMHEDGLNSLKYETVNYTRHRLFTKITVDIGSG